MATTKLRFGLWYDFRNPTQWKQSSTQLYNDIFDQIAWGEQHGFEDVWLSEHHFIDDAYSPSLLPIAAAIAARTKTIRIGTSVMLLPFHNPVRLAEDAATVDVISGGRFELGVGTGYKVEEFEGFAVSSKQRGARTNESLEIITRLWEGETVTFKGRYYEVNNAKLTPEPVQKPRPPIWGGGFTPPSFRRAAKYADGYIATGSVKAAYEQCLIELQKRGRSAENFKLASGFFWMIPSTDPEKTWNEAADHVLYQVNEYAGWGEKAGLAVVPRMRDKAHLRESGLLQVVDVDTCIRMIRDYAAEAPLTHYYSWTLPPGLPTSWIQPHLELFASKVIPAFR
ncbi:MAG: LLM class flavin-dependent oxidoreductase [Deltaproteobacteria bacterium]|nr:LLM class flavin-dependent oxidoreductase [Deltaproteobacteria bacterium]